MTPSPAPSTTDTTSPTGTPAITVERVRRSFDGGVVALDGLDLVVPRGGFTCLVGASGCGKSTLLDLLAGLSSPTSGRVAVTGRPGLLFQEAALFPWLTAQRNVELALRLRGVGRADRAGRARELLARVHLTGFEHHRPHELSGGMRQRVALARALAQDADVLLMDEPFGALDAITRDLLHDELEALWTDSDLTVVFVTHNVREAVRLGDQVVVLTSRPGRVAATYPVELPRPRSISDPDVAELSAEILTTLRTEVRRHAQH
ncbi:ABC transporter ATP-binding protein [Nitriliruptor alkaliphilus]|uniref:ABC transporter ATP-binding protein n=1 Tax=Nitriliruptor alkaliphilus TaxID=427918 RepID=UPI000698FF13|nr:ABC transporter ATP-binding protein [Nitriliruptor alkaliphilus]